MAPSVQRYFFAIRERDRAEDDPDSLPDVAAGRVRNSGGSPAAVRPRRIGARGLKARYLQRCLVMVTESAQTLAGPKWKRK